MVAECTTCGQVMERHGPADPDGCPECGHSLCWACGRAPMNHKITCKVFLASLGLVPGRPPAEYRLWVALANIAHGQGQSHYLWWLRARRQGIKAYWPDSRLVTT